ncbi:MAG: hypothetical protein EP343_13825 [Deltaproteobacteria bacterium]|nr:MAG: hypothetical protein EP343_13825 [Deltaproteobacteria bacterium]
MKNRTFWLLVGVVFVAMFAMGSRCNIRRCQVSSDCPGTQICGPGGRCVLRCKTTRDCHQNQRCVEGTCKDIE